MSSHVIWGGMIEKESADYDKLDGLANLQHDFGWWDMPSVPDGVLIGFILTTAEYGEVVQVEDKLDAQSSLLDFLFGIETPATFLVNME